MFFERLPQQLEDVAREFRQFVEEEYAVVRQADLAWAWRTGLTFHIRRIEGWLREPLAGILPRVQQAPDFVPGFALLKLAL